MHKQGIARFVLLKPPAKVLDIHEQEIKLGYKIMPSEVRLKNLGGNNILKIQNILKIRGVKGFILLDLFPKRGPRAPQAPLAIALIQDFQLRGATHLGVCRPPMRALFDGNVCENERIGSRWAAPWICK